MPEWLSYASVYLEAMRAVGDLNTDVLITVGRDADPGMLGEPPPHVRVERWVDQATVLGHTAAVICHGGGGSVLGALAAGAPLVVVPSSPRTSTSTLGASPPSAPAW